VAALIWIIIGIVIGESEWWFIAIVAPLRYVIKFIIAVAFITVH
jgi:hypothetical protein